MNLSDYIGNSALRKGSFYMFGNPFKKIFYQKSIDEQSLTLLTPLSGKIIPITKVDDPVFAQCMVGDGLAILPNSDEVVSPVSGTVTTLFPSLHAVGITTADGLEILIHVGLDTVELKGRGFTQLVRQGQVVDAGTPLIKLELDVLQKTARSLQTPVIITNMQRVKMLNKTTVEEIGFGDWIMKVSLEK